MEEYETYLFPDKAPSAWHEDDALMGLSKDYTPSNPAATKKANEKDSKGKGLHHDVSSFALLWHIACFRIVVVARGRVFDDQSIEKQE